MITKYISGDLITLFKSHNYDAMVHGCNCFNTMGKGVAKIIKDEFPLVLTVDQATLSGDRNKLGTYSKCFTNYGSIYNLYTQYTYWDKSDMLSLQAIKSGFIRINNDLVLTKESKIIIPAIGAGLARGNWSEIKDIINDATPDLDITVVIWNKEEYSKYLEYLK